MFTGNTVILVTRLIMITKQFNQTTNGLFVISIGCNIYPDNIAKFIHNTTSIGCYQYLNYSHIVHYIYINYSILGLHHYEIDPVDKISYPLLLYVTNISITVCYVH